METSGLDRSSTPSNDSMSLCSMEPPIVTRQKKIGHWLTSFQALRDHVSVIRQTLMEQRAGDEKKNCPAVLVVTTATE